MKDEITLEDFVISIVALWKYKILISSVILFFFLFGLLVTFNASTANTYSAIATVYSANYGSYQQSVTGTIAIKSYADVLTSRKLCERAASTLGNSGITAETIQRMILAGYSENENVMNITAYSMDPEIAVLVANVVADSFVFEISSITGTDAIRVLDEAKMSNITKNGQKNIILLRIAFGFVGFLLVCLYLIIKELFSDQLKTVSKCEMLAGRKILGVLPEINN